MPITPEDKARQKIDLNLEAAGWLIQDRNDLDLSAGLGIAVRGFTMKHGFGFADYLLYLDRKACGAVEAKADGTLSGVEAQSAKYAAGLPDKLNAHRRPLPFLFESNSTVTYFTNGLDPKPRSRKVFGIPRPETLSEWLDQPEQLRDRLRILPPLDETGLWKVQGQAIGNLERSNKDQLTALQIIYSGTKPLKLSLKDLRQLKNALSIPPVAASPTQLWRAFQAVESDKVNGLGGTQLADLVSLVRHALIPDFTLVPYAEEVRARYANWLSERDVATTFTAEQREWLDRMAEHIATSLGIETDDFQDGWFGQHGSLGRAHVLFGDKLKPLLAELNERLAA